MDNTPTEHMDASPERAVREQYAAGIKALADVLDADPEDATVEVHTGAARVTLSATVEAVGDVLREPDTFINRNQAGFEAVSRTFSVPPRKVSVILSAPDRVRVTVSGLPLPDGSG